MTPAERIRRIREVERHTARLVRSGWTVERVEHVDAEGEPFRTTVCLAVSGSQHEGKL